MVVHSIVDFNGEGQPTLSNQDKKKTPNTFYGKKLRTLVF